MIEIRTHRLAIYGLLMVILVMTAWVRWQGWRIEQVEKRIYAQEQVMDSVWDYLNAAGKP